MSLLFSLIFSVRHSFPVCLSLVLGTLFLSGLPTAFGEEPRQEGVKSVKDVAYYTGPDEHKVKHKLDLFLPTGKKDFPVVFFVHGGAWTFGDKSFLGVHSALGIALARQGIGAVVINYRLSPGVKHPEHIKDVARAFAWTRKNIARHGGRPDLLFACGHSAGGHLVSLMCTDATWLKAEGLSPKDVRGVIPISGVFSIPDRFMPEVFGPDGEGRRKASPITHVSAAVPPFLILFAEKDFVGCDRGPAEAFCKALTGKGATAESLEIKNADHFSILGSVLERDSTAQRAILDFVKKHSAEK